MANSQSTVVLVAEPTSISQDLVEITAESESIRRLTVSYAPRSILRSDGSFRSAPSLRLAGAWLQRAGFEVGVGVSVHVNTGRLVIEVGAPEQVPDPRIADRKL